MSGKPCFLHGSQTRRSVSAGSVGVQPEVLGSSSRKDLCLYVVALVGYLAIGRLYLLDLSSK